MCYIAVYKTDKNRQNMVDDLNKGRQKLLGVEMEMFSLKRSF